MRNKLHFFTTMSSLSWTIQRNELPLRIFLSTFLIRIIFQVLFFIWVSMVVGGADLANFALYGNIVLPALGFLFVDIFNVIRGEIENERIDMLICSSSSLLSILIGRTMGYIINSILIITLTYVLISTLLIRDLYSWFLYITALPLIVVIVLSGYSLGVLMSAFNLNEKISHNLPNLMVYLLMLLGNITIPVSALPHSLQVISNFLPLRHAIDAFRLYMTEKVPYWLNVDFYLEILILIIYGIIGYGCYLYSLKKARLNPASIR
jgi:ABC-2 type transport system permease protein